MPTQIKVKHKNYQEMLLFFNLQGVYVILSHNQGNSNAIILHLAITVAAAHFCYIIVYHTITYVCGGVIRNNYKIQLSINTFTGWITRSHRNPQYQKFRLEDTILKNIAFNYHERATSFFRLLRNYVYICTIASYY